MRSELAELVRELREHVSLQQLLGTESYLPASGGPDPPAARQEAQEAGASCSGTPRAASSLDDRREAFRRLAEEAASCVRCRLSRNRTKVVFGAGSLDAELVFVGEAPGEQEDLQGKPFVGPAGRLLGRIIAAMGLSREQVYICNIIKCRPPHNRNPRPDEIEQCEPYLLRQLELIRPQVICALGTYAVQTLLQTTASISRLRGKFYRYHDIELMPTYHPAYLLRNPTAKRLVWKDMQRVQEKLGIPPGDYSRRGAHQKG